MLRRKAGEPMTASHPIRRGRKFGQVLAGARTVFLRDGFERASVDDIAREAGVSKATLYSYFPDKSLIFMEVAKTECQNQANEAMALALVGDLTSIRDVLTFAAERVVEFIQSDLGQSVFRICVAEGLKFPELAREFYVSVPQQIRANFSAFLRERAEAGQLEIADFDLAADQFMQLCKANVHERLLFGMADTLTPAEERRTVVGAVDTFLARYGVKPPAA